MKGVCLGMVAVAAAALTGCVGGGSGDDLAGDGSLCDGQQVETITVVEQNREGQYTTTRDVITGECLAPQVQLRRGFEVVIEDPGNRIDLALAKALLERDETVVALRGGGEGLIWRDTFAALFADSSYTHNEGSFHTGGIELEIEFLITDGGTLRATTIADDDAAHLAIFGTNTGQINTRSFAGAPLRESAYADARSRYNSNLAQANFLAHMLSSSYARLARGGAMRTPLANHAELYSQSPTVINSFFKRDVFVMRSFIYHNRTDYDALEPLEVPVVATWNELWSPLGHDNRDPDGTVTLARSYNVDYEGGANSDSLTYLETWSGSHELLDTTEIRAVGHYGGDFAVSHRVDEPGSHFNIDCGAALGGCTLGTRRNAGVAAYIQGFAPTRVEMSLTNSWALGHTAVVTASFSDWDTFGRTESPLNTRPGAHPNPNPNPTPGVVPRAD